MWLKITTLSLTINYTIMVNKFQTYIRVKTRSMILENFSAAECAKVFDVEYRNMCAYIRGSKEIPLNLCLDILEYLGAKLVIFRGL